MSMDLSEKDFKNQKKQILAGVDVSRKGSIDEAIIDLVLIMNNSADFVTTSSCSGRVLLFCQNNYEKEKRKQNCKWIYSRHDLIDSDILISHIDPSEGELVLKFEPFILHVQCRTLEAAKIVQKCALESGFRNSGIVVGQHGKITLAVRSTHSLEVPLSNKGKLLVSDEEKLESSRFTPRF
ncbi:tRNA wybutosine-synthesizing protein 3 homolog isoform X2 [Lycorma delicatula]|uniref:tRNA wybutosine-synthesizing protein 3 homolog isoform X2 n=1 Tax=Lycorma delicatula TaxID=130591 RepID=UPI003F50DE2B